MKAAPQQTASLLVLCLVLACGDDDGGIDAGTDAGADAPMADAPAIDAPVIDAPIDAGPVSCAALSETSAFLLAPGLRQTQLHPAVAFDGEQIWITLTVDEEAGSAFDIVLLRHDCGGNLQGDPIVVTQAVPPNDIDASIALGDDSILLAWQRDESTGTITTWTRAFELDGTPRADERRYDSYREGALLDTTVWFPELQRREGGFWLTGVRGIEGVGFQVYAQELDHDGAGGVDDALEPVVSTVEQTGLRLLEQGEDLHFAWSETIDDNDQGVYLAPGETEPAILVDGFIASNVGDLVAHGDALVAGVRVGTANGTIHLLEVGEAETTEVASGQVGVPSLAAGEGTRGAVLWTDQQSGFTAEELWVRGYTVDGGVTLDDAREINVIGPVGLPYGPSVTHLSGDYYLATWTEREGELWQSWGQILEL